MANKQARSKPSVGLRPQKPVGGFANKSFGRGVGDKTSRPSYGTGQG